MSKLSKQKCMQVTGTIAVKRHSPFISRRSRAGGCRFCKLPQRTLRVVMKTPPDTTPLSSGGPRGLCHLGDHPRGKGHGSRPRPYLPPHLTAPRPPPRTRHVFPRDGRAAADRRPRLRGVLKLGPAARPRRHAGTRLPAAGCAGAAPARTPPDAEKADGRTLARSRV